MELKYKIQAILFHQAEPLSFGRLAKLLRVQEGEVRDAARALAEGLSGTGLTLIENGNEIMLGTSPEAGNLIAEITKEELSKELSKATLETLAIVLYKGPITRAEIDYVRGVNSNFILRNLTVRGLVERIDNPNDQRSFLYKPTFELLEYMGVSRIEDLPEYEKSMTTLASFAATKEEGGETEAKERTEGSTDTDEASPVPERDELDLELEADIAEEDATGDAYDDNGIKERRGEDERPEMQV